MIRQLWKGAKKLASKLIPRASEAHTSAEPLIKTPISMVVRQERARMRRRLKTASAFMGSKTRAREWRMGQPAMWRMRRHGWLEGGQS